MTGATAGIGKGLTGLGDELPVVARGMQAQLQDPEGVVVGRLDIGRRVGQRDVVGTAGADDELADTMLPIEGAIRVLERVALIVVIMSSQDNLRPRVIERLPQRLGVRVVGVFAKAEAGMVPVGQGTGGGMGSQIGA